MAEEHTTTSTKRTATKKAASRGPRAGHYRELHDEEIYEDEPGASGAPRATRITRTSSWDIGVPAGLTNAWDHIVNAEKEYVMAFLSLFGIDDELAERAQRRRASAERRRQEEHIEVREVHVE